MTIHIHIYSSIWHHSFIFDLLSSIYNMFKYTTTITKHYLCNVKRQLDSLSFRYAESPKKGRITRVYYCTQPGAFLHGFLQRNHLKSCYVSWCRVYELIRMSTGQSSMGSIIAQEQDQICRRGHHTFKSLMTPKLFLSSAHLSLMLINGYNLSLTRIIFFFHSYIILQIILSYF